MTPKQKKQREEYIARQFYESQAKGKLESTVTIGGYTYHLSYKRYPGEHREIEYSAACPVEGCTEDLKGDDNDIAIANSLCVGRIKSHFKMCHEKG
jgi:hypothetical protein